MYAFKDMHSLLWCDKWRSIHFDIVARKPSYLDSDVYCSSLVHLVLVTPRGAQGPNSVLWYGDDIPGLNNKPSAIFAASFKDLKRVTICFSVLNLIIWIPLLPSSLTKAIASENEYRTWTGSGLNDKHFVQTLLPAN